MVFLQALKPRYWLAAHMHCFFPALVPHSNKNNSENDFGLTRFLSLDKPLPRRHFLQVIIWHMHQSFSFVMLLVIDRIKLCHIFINIRGTNFNSHQMYYNVWSSNEHIVLFFWMLKIYLSIHSAVPFADFISELFSISGSRIWC